MTDKYILVGREAVKLRDLDAWARWYEKVDRVVGSTKGNGVHVSTVFLGLDHSFGHGDPLLFETMIFGGKHDDYQERYATWQEAEEGHRKACDMAGVKG